MGTFFCPIRVQSSIVYVVLNFTPPPPPPPQSASDAVHGVLKVNSGQLESSISHVSVNVTNVMPASEIVVKALISFDLAVRTPCVQLELEMCAEAHFRTYRCWQYKTCQDGVGDSEIEDRAYQFS